MSDHVIEPILVSERKRPSVEFEFNGDVSARTRCAGGANDGFQVGQSRLSHRCRAGAQLEHELIHPADDMLDRGQHVALEFRVVTMSLGILEHKR